MVIVFGKMKGITMKKKLLLAAVITTAMSVCSPTFAANPLDVPDGKVIQNQSAEQGGAINNALGEFVPSPALTVGSNVQFLNNTAIGKGGAIQNLNADITIGDNAKFVGNNAIWHGGAIAHWAADGKNYNFTLGKGAEFTRNGSIEAFKYDPSQWSEDFILGKFTGTGGAIDYESGNDLNILQALFNSNQAFEGGAITTSKFSTGNINISDTTFNLNATASAGGAIAIQNNVGALGIEGSTFKGNNAYASGGAIWSFADVNISNSTFDGNEATGTAAQVADRYSDVNDFVSSSPEYDGGFDTDLTESDRVGLGGGALYIAENASATIDSSTFSNNFSQTVGGAIATHTGAKSLSITDSSFSNNTAVGNGGAIHSTVDLSIKAENKDVSFTGNEAAKGADIYLANSGKTLTLDVASDKTMSFDGGIDLNKGNMVITNAGNVLVNAAIENAASINLSSDSSLKLGQNFSLSGTPDVTIAGALNSQNGKIDTINVNNFTGGGSWDLDVDLANEKADYFNISGNANEQLSIDVDKIAFLSSSDKEDDLKIDVSNKEILNLLDKDLYVDEFKLDNTLSNGQTLVFHYVSNPFEEMPTDDTVLNITKDYTVDKLGEVQASDYVVQSATGSAIVAANKQATGFVVGTDKGLTLNNITMDGFTNGITNNGGKLKLMNASFKNSSGAAIVTDSDLTITADKGTSTFEGNTNAVELTNANLTLDAKNNGAINLNDSIKSNDKYTLTLAGNESGSVNINNSIGNASVVLDGTNLKLGDVAYLNGLDFTGNSGTIDMRNGATEHLNLGSLTLNNNINLAVNVDFLGSDKASMDTISAGKYEFNGHNINISNITLLNDSTEKVTEIPFANDDLKGNISTNVTKTAYSPIYEYGVSYDAATGAFTFDRSENKFNSSILVAPVAAQLGGYFTQLNSYDQAFMNMDMKMLMPRKEREALKMLNKYAYSGDGTYPMVYSPLYNAEAKKGGWFRPYASFENVGLRNGSRVSNVMYGSFFGADSNTYELKNGAEIQYSVYAGYNGSHQAYQGNSLYQNGGTLGASALLNKGNFFTALTANAGANIVDASTMFGSEDFAMLMAGVASETGYNWELKEGKFIVQPNVLLSYSFVNAFDYTNAAGVKVNADPLHAIHFAPGVKFIANLKNGWQPYAAINMAWNFMDDTHFKANDVSLPELSVKPYIQYGVGVQKRWGDRFTGFGQAMIRNGGRNGLALSFGFRFALGKAPEHTSYTASSEIKQKPTEIRLSGRQ